MGLILVNSLLLLLTSFVGSQQVLFSTYGFVPSHPHLSTAITSMFLHVGFWHLFGNMWFLWMFGCQVERAFGYWLFCFVYLFCGLGGSFLHYLLNSTSILPCVGASGAISGIAGCFFILFPRAKFDLVFYLGWATLKTVHTGTHVAVGAWILEQALLGLLSLKFHSLSIAFWAHVGGFAVGLATGGVLFLIRKKTREASESA